MPTGLALWPAVLTIAALFVGWEFLTHFSAHKLITSNKTTFFVTVIVVGLTGSAIARSAFRYLDRLSGDAPRGGRGAASGDLGLSESRDARAGPSLLAGSGATVASLPIWVGIGRLRWVAILAPAGLFIAWESLTHFLLHSLVVSEKTIFYITIGAITLGATVFTQFLFRTLQRMQQQLVRQNRELASRTTALEALYEIGTGLSALLDVGTVKATAVRRARQLLGTDTAGLALLHEATGEVRWELLAGTTGDQFRSLKLQLGQCIGGQAIQSGEPVIIEDVSQEMEHLSATHPLLVVEELHAALVVPVRIAGKPIGALMVGHRTPYSFHLSDLKLLMSLANQVSVAINNAHLYERLGALSALEERERLAREMHDGLAQLLGNVTARATATGELLGRGKVDEAGSQLVRLRDAAQEAYMEVRQSILGLRTSPQGNRGLVEALGEFVKRVTDQEGMPVHLETCEGVGDLQLTPTVEVQAIRIIQEALSNVRKHSRAREAWVRVERDSRGTTITIQDSGQGFDPARVDGMGSHFGLQTMRERAEAMGGHLTIETAPGRGTSVTIQLPVGGEE